MGSQEDTGERANSSLADQELRSFPGLQGSCEGVSPRKIYLSSEPSTTFFIGAARDHGFWQLLIPR